ncbi:calcium-binding protein [Falsiroseomonas tokyonensis]|uniref:Calcium-binding protein n=1 Tax=Falsiroseomonas tokyonensis TaxID=430521 RepID=A0ABV7BLX5_9PROT|nr:calcium-binding protein [Falsiroseomonas tokyonensis]MBU8536569.1 hypothetical protein [Falsiroseomonas tokyonensis]
MTSTNPEAIESSALSKVSGGQQAQGTPGHDTITTGHENDLVFGQGGSDLISTGQGDDQVQAGDGDDNVQGGDGQNLLFGEAGNDFMHSGEGNDQLQGGQGNDILLGGGGTDQIFGGDGNDIMDGGANDGSADYVKGGMGDDSFVWAPGSGNDSFQGGPGQDTITLPSVTLQQLQSGLNMWTGGLTMQVNSEGYVTFTNAQGQPVSFAGQLTINGETLTFQDVEKLRISV